MVKVNVVIPDKLSEELKIYKKDLVQLLEIGLKEVKVKQSLSLFKDGNISLWKAARLAGVSLREITMHAIAHGLRPKIDREILEEEIA